MEEGRRSRGYLPHVEGQNLTQFVTFHLADALPKHVLDEMIAAMAELPESERKADLARRIEAYCDAGHGECLLGNPRAARALERKLFDQHERFFSLHAWCVMPNHAHALLTPCPGITLARCMQRIKGGSASDINRLLGRQGRLWQPESYDVYMRSEKHFYGVVNYIEWNPVKAGLSRDPKLYTWSSANDEAWKRLENHRNRKP